MENNIDNLILTDYAKQFLEDGALRILANDFAGFLVFFDKHYKLGIAVNLDGDYTLFSNTKKPLSQRKLDKALTKLIKTGFLYYYDSPFEEFRPVFDFRKTFIPDIIIEGNMFEAV